VGVMGLKYVEFRFEFDPFYYYYEIKLQSKILLLDNHQLYTIWEKANQISSEINPNNF
jgi:hypothetical protein